MANLNRRGEPCSCPDTSCPNNGKCDACRALHAELGKPNACDQKAAAQEK